MSNQNLTERTSEKENQIQEQQQLLNTLENKETMKPEKQPTEFQPKIFLEKDSLTNSTKELDLERAKIDAKLKENKRKNKQKNKIVQDIKEIIFYIFLFLKSL